MNKYNSSCVQTNISSDEVDCEKENTKTIVTELIDLLNDDRSYQDIGIVTEITKTVHLLIKQGDARRKQVISHPSVSIGIHLC